MTLMVGLMVPVLAGGAEVGSGLQRDLTTLVLAAEQQSWSIDRYEVLDLLPQALLSVCQSKASEREAALAGSREGTEALRTRWGQNNASFEGIIKM